MRAVTLVAMLVAAALAGCFGNGAEAAAMKPAPLRLGASAQYATEGGATMDVRLASSVAQDLTGVQVDALLVHRWLNDSRHGLRIYEIDVLEADSGHYLWSARPCTYDENAGGCTGHASVTLTVRGLPGLLGIRWAATSPLAASEGSCARLDGSDHPIHDRQMLGFYPAALAEGREILICADAPFPRSFSTWEGETFTLVRHQGGAGPPLRFAEPGARGAVGVASPRAPWDGHAPPVERHRGAFPWSEALEWLRAHSAEFRDFEDDHPAYHLHSTYVTGGSGGRLGPDSRPLAEEWAQSRVLSVQAPDGSSLTFHLEKSSDFLGRVSVRQTDARAGSGILSLLAAHLPPEHVPQDAAEADYLGRVNGTWQDTQVLTVLPALDGTPEPTRTFFVYRVLLRPEGTDPHEFQVFPYVANYRSDTGDLLQFLLAAEELRRWTS